MQIRVLTTPAEFNAIPDLEIAVWGLNPKDVVSGNIIRALTINGGVAHGAYDGQRMIGMSLAFPGVRGKKRFLWSHMAAVLPELQGQGIGFALKQAQRDWALAHGTDEMRWTFDPLQRGNAHFNLHLLGVTSETYHVDFYGQMEDAINVAAPTDRLEAIWSLKDDRVKDLAAGGLPTAPPSIPSETIVVPDAPLPDQPFLHIELPRRARELTPQVSLEWRLRLRTLLRSAFAGGYRAIDLLDEADRAFYRLERLPGYQLYVVECSDGSLYTGIARDVEKRVAQHNAGRGAAYTKQRRPVRLLAAWPYPSRSAALKAEAAFKKLTRAEKLRHIASQTD